MAEDNSWKFAQCFGDKGDVDEITNADIISAVEFDPTGDFLATGDRGGRVVLFERSKNKKNCEYKFYTEFQSHEPEFDYLKSVEIEEKINKIRWCPRQNDSHFLLTTNDRTVKLWKVYEKQLKVVAENNTNHTNFIPKSRQDLKLPLMQYRETAVAATPKRIFANAHTYHINSVSISSDGETFLSADDLRINVWNLHNRDESFNIVDIKPANMEDLTEVITAAEFHPHHSHLFMYSSSKGIIKLNDMRMSALCDTHYKSFEDVDDDPSKKNFLNEILASITDIRFSQDGRYILSRDYMTVKVWDINMDNRPVATFNVHDHLKSKLCDLYEADCVFDKFECTFNGDGTSIMTGSYHNYLTLFNMKDKSEVTLQADKSAFRQKRNPGSARKLLSRKSKKDDINVDAIDFNKKILHTSWHPKENSIAIAATNNLFIFSQLFHFNLSFGKLLEMSFLTKYRITPFHPTNLLNSNSIYRFYAKAKKKSGPASTSKEEEKLDIKDPHTLQPGDPLTGISIMNGVPDPVGVSKKCETQDYAGGCEECEEEDFCYKAWTTSLVFVDNDIN
ncbi:Protein phosphatase 2A, regulatory subunit PR55 domain-containing protein [Rozella allomycis CSF55]|uniref:Protein phosphatase PP2A regulatory subunit B n=1 Tax=Rozella allomycis (strain CSF55) TaxID=988480 RepID=A0A075B540_ROZAC|nr:Protein phosphatase 2A, regulatory subunit PR55 domain-containing protein [Rozella allomycis CSF55]|eukprot:EPZ36718.1 Protein phosphatase 2A, regulatory subunit PR55 domain-containing protein [Rozella allomycis CSF55]